MDFAAVYTTNEKIAADTAGTEAKKTILSNDAFAIGEMISNLIKQIEGVRLSKL